MRSASEGLALLLIGGIAIWGASLVPPPPEGETWAGVLPMGAALLLTACGAGLTFAALSGAGGAAMAAKFSAQSASVLGLIAVAAGYYLAIVRFGYELPTAIAAPLALWLFGTRHPVSLIAAAILCPMAFHLIFFKGLGVFPPYGEIVNPMDWLER